MLSYTGYIPIWLPLFNLSTNGLTSLLGIRTQVVQTQFLSDLCHGSDMGIQKSVSGFEIGLVTVCLKVLNFDPYQMNDMDVKIFIGMFIDSYWFYPSLEWSVLTHTHIFKWNGFELSSV